MNGRWMVQRAEHCEDTCCILEFLLEEFEQLFGHDVMFNEDCVVYNDPRAVCPRLIYGAPVKIRLHQKSLSFWSQTIFQLSHEMCHYAIKQRTSKNACSLSWFEEIVCEAVSLYALEYASKNWARCRLSHQSPAFFRAHQSYLDDELADAGSDGLKRCDTVEKLMEYETQGWATTRRESYAAERINVYRAISAHPAELKCVLDYTRYVMSNGATIDFDRWIQDVPCRLVFCLKNVQPVRI